MVKKMISRKVLTIVSEKLADMRYIERCNRLDEILEDSMTKAFEGELISIERRDRILKKFAENVMGSEKQ